MTFLPRVLAAAAVAAFLGSAPAHATVQLITNGDFETGDFTGWNVNTQLDSQGDLFIEPNVVNGASPISSSDYPFNTNGGRWFAESDQAGPGSYSLTQFFKIGPKSGQVVVSYDLFANTYADVAANGRDFHFDPNQNVEVAILTAGADPFTNDPADMVAVLYPQGADGSVGVPNPWTSYSFNLGVLTPGLYQIRFAETDNQSYFNMGVDNVSILAAPEPAQWVMLLTGFGALGMVLRRRKAPLAT